MNNIISRHISSEVKEKIIKRQDNKCANFPEANLWQIGDYSCPLWKNDDGIFDRAGYEIDHVIEFCLTKDNNIDNLQALCPMCHTVKTKMFDRQDVSYINEINDNDAKKMCTKNDNEDRNFIGCLRTMVSNGHIKYKK